MLLLLLLLLLFVCPTMAATTTAGVPGTTQTISGYDTELGTDPICWRTPNALNETLQDVLVLPNPLVDNFTISSIQLLSQCPPQLDLQVELPKEFQNGERPRTRRTYNYTITIHINATTLLGDNFGVSSNDNETGVGVLQILVCELRSSGFCSPFVHEQSNARLERQYGSLPPVNKGDRHGGTHVHSPFVTIPLSESSWTQSVPMVVNEPGEFYVVGALQFYTSTTEQMWRYDVANAPTHDRIVLYQDPPTILQVRSAVLILSYVLIGMASCVVLTLLVLAIRYRKHAVFQLSQVTFLVWTLIMAFLAILFSIFINPHNDRYCRLGFPLVLVPLQAFLALTAGRLWRIHAVISPLLVEARLRTAATPSSSSWCGRWKRILGSKRNRQALRQEIPPWKLVARVVGLTAPLGLAQVLARILQPLHQDVQLNSDESMGRVFCDTEDDQGWLYTLTWFYWGASLIYLVVLAYRNRNLPSLFNESRVIYDSLLMSVLVLILGGGIILILDGPTLSPDVPYLTSVVVVLCLTLNTSLRIMVPKLIKVRRNETILVSKLVTDHRRKKQERQQGKEANVSGMEPSTTVNNSAFEYMQERQNDGIVLDEESAEATPTDDTNTNEDATPTHSTNKKEERCILIRPDETPSRRLLLQMVEMQTRLGFLNRKLLSGMGLDQDEWDELRKDCRGLGQTFEKVQFDWEEEEPLLPCVPEERTSAISLEEYPTNSLLQPPQSMATRMSSAPELHPHMFRSNNNNTLLSTDSVDKTEGSVLRESKPRHPSGGNESLGESGSIIIAERKSDLPSVAEAV